MLNELRAFLERVKAASMDVPDAWSYEKRIPVRTFRCAVALLPDGGLVHTTRADHGRDVLEGEIIRHLRDLRRAGHDRLEVMPCELERFDAVAIQGPSMHRIFAKVPELHRRTTVAFPVYRCEFEGDETEEEVRLMQQRVIDTSDWSRKPCPKLRFRIVGPHGRGTVGDGPVLLSLADAVGEIGALENPSDHHAEVVNYQRQAAKLVPSGPTEFTVTAAGESAAVPRNELREWLLAFGVGDR